VGLFRKIVLVIFRQGDFMVDWLKWDKLLLRNIWTVPFVLCDVLYRVSQKTRNPYRISKYPNSFKIQYFWTIQKPKEPHCQRSSFGFWTVQKYWFSIELDHFLRRLGYLFFGDTRYGLHLFVCGWDSTLIVVYLPPNKLLLTLTGVLIEKFHFWISKLFVWPHISYRQTHTPK